MLFILGEIFAWGVVAVIAWHTVIWIVFQISVAEPHGRKKREELEAKAKADALAKAQLLDKVTVDF